MVLACMDIVVLAYMCIYIHVCVACMRFVQSYQDRVLVEENLLHLAPLVPFLVKDIMCCYTLEQSSGLPLLRQSS